MAYEPRVIATLTEDWVLPQAPTSQGLQSPVTLVPGGPCALSVLLGYLHTWGVYMYMHGEFICICKIKQINLSKVGQESTGGSLCFVFLNTRMVH